MRPIDADALKEAITQNREIDRNAVCDVLDIIDNAPTVEQSYQEPKDYIKNKLDYSRPQGEWMYDNILNNWKCSECGETPKTIGYVGTRLFMEQHFKFCNHCGADMRGGRE